MPFWKSELTQLGRARLLDEGNFAGVRLGFSNVADTYFVEVRPGVRLALFDEQLKLELAAPLRFEIFDLSRLQDRGDIFARTGEFVALTGDNSAIY